MVGNISLSASMRANLLALQGSSMLQDMTQNRLATGKKVNSAIDNPSSFFTAASLNNRATDLSTRLDGIGQSLQILKGTSDSLNTLTTLVSQAKALATSALQAAGGTTSTLTSVEAKSVKIVSGSVGATTTVTAAFASNTVSSAADITISINGGTAYTLTAATVWANTSVTGIVANLNSNAAFTSNGVMAYYNSTTQQIEFAGKAGTTIAMMNSTTNVTDSVGDVLFGANANKTFTMAAPTTGTAWGEAFGFTAGVATAGFNIQVTDTSGSTTVSAAAVTISIAASLSISAMVAALNAVDAAIRASYNTSTNKIEFAAKSGIKVTLTDVTASGGTVLFGSAAVANATTFGSSNNTAAVAQNKSDFDSLMSQIDQTVADASYNGTNLLKGSATMTVLFNEDGSSSLAVAGVNFTYNGATSTTAGGTGGGLGFSTKSSLHWDTTAGDIQKSIDQATNALTTIRNQASSFGNANATIQARQDFTTNLINTLKSGSDKLTLADMNEESANMLALQTQRQLATNALSMASQAAQSVLQLFR